MIGYDIWIDNLYWNYSQHIVEISLCAVVVLLGLCVALAFARNRTFSIIFWVIVGIGYLMFLFLALLGVREVNDRIILDLKLHFLQSNHFWDGLDKITTGDIANIILFLPWGVVLRELGGKRLRWYGCAGLSFALSAGLELTQLWTRRGWCDVNDLVCNMLGAMLGYGMSYGIARCLPLERKENRVKSYYVYLGLMVATMILIFFFSSQNGEDSSMVSNSVLQAILDWFGRVLSVTFLEFLKEKIRKVAHFAIYCLLGMFAALWMRQTKIKKKAAFPAAWILAVCYACTDELHQLFVPGRAGQLKDVGIDSLGALLGVLLVGLLVLCKKSRVR